jgi:hypothetical protein
MNRFSLPPGTPPICGPEVIPLLLRDLPDNVREALRCWYTTDKLVETICAECGISQAYFSEIRQQLRARFFERREIARRKPAVPIVRSLSTGA